MAEKRNLHELLDHVEQLWSPHVVGEVNDYDVKVAKVAGEFAEHVHVDTDEVFLVLSGRLHLDLPDMTVTLNRWTCTRFPEVCGTAHAPTRARGSSCSSHEAPRKTAHLTAAPGYG